MQEGKMNTKKYRRLRGQTLCVKQVATEMCPLRPLVALVMGVSASERKEVDWVWWWQGKNATVPNVAVLKIGVCRRINLFKLFSLGFS